MMLSKKHMKFVEYIDDERITGNGIIITLKEGFYFYDDCGVMGFDTVRELKEEINMIEKKYSRH